MKQVPVDGVLLRHVSYRDEYLRHRWNDIPNMSMRTDYKQSARPSLPTRRADRRRTEIDRMVQSAEKFCVESEPNKARIEAKNW